MITIKNLSIFHGKKCLLDNINFHIKKGERVVLLGQSGSGKTLTSLALMHLLPHNLTATGEILYNNMPFHKKMRGTQIGMIMQSPASCFDQAFTMQHFFYDALISHHKTEKLTDTYFCEIIENVGLKNPKDILASYPFQLSGGMLQRIMIGLSLALETEFIIADEPTSDIDCIAEYEILELLKKLEKKQQALLLITHNIKTATQIADRILVMHQGKLIDNFETKNLYNENRHTFTKELIMAHKNLTQNAWGINFHV